LKNLIICFDKFKAINVSQASNDSADVLSKLVNTKKAEQYRTLIQDTLNTPSWDCDDVLHITTGNTIWITPIISYLTKEVLLSNSNEARKLR